MPKTARAYASVNKTTVLTGTEVSTYGYVSCDYFRNVEKTEISHGNWTLDIWYTKDALNDVEQPVFGDTYYSMTGEKKFWFKKPRDVKGKATSIITNHLNEPDDSYVYLASAWVDFPTEEPPPEDVNQNLGITPTDPNQSPSPGKAYEVRVITDAPYSQVYWYVKAPWETSTYGTNVEIDEGDGTTTEASMTYTFPSGAMHTGEFTITAYIYRDDLSVYEETYTVNVTID